MDQSEEIAIAVLETKLVNLRDMMEAKFKEIETQLYRLQAALDKLTDVTVMKTQHQQQVKKVERAHIRLDDLEKKIARYEQVTRLLNIVWGIASAIIVAVFIALATGRAHIVWQ